MKYPISSTITIFNYLTLALLTEGHSVLCLPWDIQLSHLCWKISNWF